MLISYCTFFILTYLYLTSASSRDPTSYFFDPDIAYTRDYTARRLEQVEHYLEVSGTVQPQPHQRNKPPRLCLGIATVGRRGDQYVDLTVGSVLAGLNPQERSEIFLNVLIGHTRPSDHPSFGHKWLDNLPDRVLEYSHDDEVREQIRAWEEGGWYRNKTIYDYTYLLNDCYETGAEYVAMLEDDTLAAEDWYSRTTQALTQVETEMAKSNTRWIYLRLFYADDLLGWNSENWLTYLFWSFLTWSISTILLLLARRRLKVGYEYLSSATIAAISIVCIPSAIILYFMAGKQTVLPIRPGVHVMNKYGCCSQGFVFPRSIIPDFLSRADLVTDWLVDMMIEKIADKEGWTRWVVVPSLLQHIGATSSKGYGFDDAAKLLWNFRFERTIPPS